jgi:diguanylate cyclase (GGDEF)-like protein/PAS domain S-box-containing protein
MTSASAFFMTLANNYNFALILANVQIFAVMFQPIATLILIVNFAGYKHPKINGIYKYFLYLIPLAIIVMLLLFRGINTERINFGYIMVVSNMKFIAPIYLTSVNIFAACFLGFEIHKRKKLNRFYGGIRVLLIGIIIYILGETIYQALLMIKVVVKIPSGSISMILFYLFILISLFSIKINIKNISLKNAFEDIQDCIIITDNNGDILEFNKCIKDKLFKANENELNKKNYSSENIKKLISKMISNETESDRFFKLLESSSNDSSKIEIVINNDGNPLTYDTSISPILDSGNNILGKISIFRDITMQKKYEKKIEHFSFYDKLTDLYNRRYFEEELKRFDTKRQLPISIIMADIDRLKYVNDELGHSWGDKLIINASRIIKNSCRKEDVVARWGGDEFIVLLTKATEKDTIKVITRIKKACSSKSMDDRIKISVSLGFSTKNDSDEKIEDIIKQADINMYVDKARLKKSQIISSQT